MKISVASRKIRCMSVLFLSSAAVVSWLAFYVPAQAQSILDGCDIGEFDDGGALLTASEKIALMDKHFNDSLTAFAECMAKESSAPGGDGAEAAAAGGIQGTASDQSQSEQEPTQSVASFSGDAQQSSDDQDFTPTPVYDSQDDSSGTNPPTPIALNNGKMPEDIQQYDNDTALESQIKQAALNEEDPILREKLWDQYRIYKNAN